LLNSFRIHGHFGFQLYYWRFELMIRRYPTQQDQLYCFLEQIVGLIVWCFPDLVISYLIASSFCRSGVRKYVTKSMSCSVDPFSISLIHLLS
jgi:hypothetical protein